MHCSDLWFLFFALWRILSQCSCTSFSELYMSVSRSLGYSVSQYWGERGRSRKPDHLWGSYNRQCKILRLNLDSLAFQSLLNQIPFHILWRFTLMINYSLVQPLCCLKIIFFLVSFSHWQNQCNYLETAMLKSCIDGLCIRCPDGNSFIYCFQLLWKI